MSYKKLVAIANRPLKKERNPSEKKSDRTDEKNSDRAFINYINVIKPNNKHHKGWVSLSLYPTYRKQSDRHSEKRAIAIGNYERSRVYKLYKCNKTQQQTS
jgi:hypothetical protein